MAKSDLELLSAWRDGDQRAGESLFDRHFKPLYRFFRGKTTRGVDDLVQKTFLACVEGKDRFRGDSSFRTYLFAAARRILYRSFETTRKHDQALDFGVTSVAALQERPSEILAEKHEQRLLLEALRRIPLDYQIALELYHFEGLRGPELAQILDIPEPTVRGRLRRGLEQLRKVLAELEQDPSAIDDTVHGLETWAAEIRELLDGA